MQRAAFVLSALMLASGAALQAAPSGPALDFSTEADETGDVFAYSVEQRYASPVSAAAAVADLRAAGMTCTQGATTSCTKAVSANDCTYTFVVTITGTAERAIVRGQTRLGC